MSSLQSADSHAATSAGWLALPRDARGGLRAPAFTFGHGLAGHPAFSVDALAELLDAS